MSGRFELDIAVVGGGSFGTVLANLLAEAGRCVRLWVRRDELADEINKERRNSRYLGEFSLSSHLEACSDLQATVRDARVVLVVVPSHGFREAARQLGNHVQGDQILVHATKGFEISTFKRMSELLREETCALKLGVLSGPNLAREIIAGHPTGALIASRFHEVVLAMQELFAGTLFRLYRGQDVIGTEVAGAFKNVIALAAGISDGMGFGDNSKALVLTRGLGEMTRLGVLLGGQPGTFGGLSGIGDLMATCASPLSRNHQVGERLGRGETLDEILATMNHVAEGVPTTEAVHLHADHIDLELPIVSAVHRVLYAGQSCEDALSELMARPAGDELARLRSLGEAQ